MLAHTRLFTRSLFNQLLTFSLPAMFAGNLCGGTDFVNHGVPVPAGNARTIVAMEDSNGKPIIFSWLLRGAIIIDAETGEAEQYPVPVQLSRHVTPFHFLMTDDNKFYTVVGLGNDASVMLEFDVHARQWKELGRGPYRAAMSMTHDTKNDILYAGLYPDNHLLSYDRRNGRLTDHGVLIEESWPQYPRKMELDSEGWLYVAIGNEGGNLIAFNPANGEVRQIAGNDERLGHWANLHLADDGKVYGELYVGGPRYVLFRGEAIRVDTLKPEITPHRKGHQYTTLPDFPDGSTLEDICFVDKKAIIRNATNGEIREIHFDYNSGLGDAHIYTLAEGPDGDIIGGTGRLMRVFRFDPKSGSFTHMGVGDQRMGHVNSLGVSNKRIFGGNYSSGSLFEFDTLKPPQAGWNTTEANPRLLAAHWDDLRRPSSVLALQDDRYVLMGGLPSVRKPAGGLLVYDLERSSGELLTHEQLVPFQSIYSILELPDSLVLCGTRAEEGSDGSARLFLFDVVNRVVVDTYIPVEDAYDIRDMVITDDGLVFGVARVTDRNSNDPNAGIPMLFVFDPLNGEVVHLASLESYSTQFGGMNDGGMLVAHGDSIYAFFPRTIVQIDARSLEHRALAAPPQAITNAGVALDNRIYFAAGTNLWSFGTAEAADE